MVYRKKKWLIGLLLFTLAMVLIAFAGYFFRITQRPSIPDPTPEMQQHAKNVRILRDDLGVPHIFGKTDENTAFGLAYAGAEDDFPTIQGSLAAARGKLALLICKKISIINDYLVNVLFLKRRVEEQYGMLSPEFKKILAAYADGLNFYAACHPEEVDSRLLPYTGKDVMAGFIHKLALFTGVGATLEDLLNMEKTDRKVGQKIQYVLTGKSILPFWTRGEVIGSNAHAVGPGRSADGITRLNINSHQPYEGPVAWYEAHLVSKEGWDCIGGTFPGGPVVLHGHNKNIGWAHTVNKPDAVDVYKLTMHPDGSTRYKFDGEWKQLLVTEGRIEIDTGFFTLPVTRKLFESIHGPVIKIDGEFYAIRYAGMNRSGLSVEQWYRMNKAGNIDEWKKAMTLQGIPMMNTLYADKENIFYVYNHLLPVRSEKYDWLSILPGDTKETLWDAYIPFEALPSVENPPSGYIMNTNSTPFETTVGKGNPDPSKFSVTLGIETRMNNRALRSHELYGKDESITREEFLSYKFDRKYTASSSIFKDVINPLRKELTPKNEAESKALEILDAWDGVADEESHGATLANLIYRPIFKVKTFKPGAPVPDEKKAFRDAVAFLMKHYDRVDVPLGQVQRLVRGKTDLALGGSMDTLNAVHTEIRGDKMVGTAGDSYILVVEFSESGTRSWARHQYGNVNRKDSVHYDDQAEAFTKRTLRKSLLTSDDIRARLAREYHPGK
jgi:acyl-homoserine-lactone acylase